MESKGMQEMLKKRIVIYIFIKQIWGNNCS